MLIINIINLALIYLAIHYVLKLTTLIGTRVMFFSFILLNFAQQIAAIIYLNTGTFVTELGRTTYFIPKSAPLYIFYVDVYLASLCFFASRRRQWKYISTEIDSTQLSNVFCHCMILLTFVMVCYTLTDMVISGIPMFSPFITRYNYYSRFSKLPLASTVNNWLYLSMFLLGYVYVHLKKERLKKICIALVIATTVIRFLLGSKMSGLIDIPINFLSVVFLLTKAKFRSVSSLLKPKYIVSVLGLAVVAIGFFVASSVLNGNANTVAAAFDILFNRALALGNHMWWALEADSKSGNSILGHNLAEEIWAVLTAKSPYDLNTGMYHLMLKYGVGYIVNVDIQSRIRFAASFITTSVYNWGYIFAVIPIVVVAQITIWYVFSIEKALRNGKFFQLTLLCKTWGTFLTFIVGSGTFTEWLNPENYFYFILYFVLNHVGRHTTFTIGWPYVRKQI